LPKTKSKRNERLYYAIKSSPLTFQQVADLVKVDRSTIYRMVHQSTRTARDTVESLCKILGNKTPEELGFNYDGLYD